MTTVFSFPKRSLFSPETGERAERFNTLALLAQTLPAADHDGVVAFVGVVAPFVRYRSDGVEWAAEGSGGGGDAGAGPKTGCTYTSGRLTGYVQNGATHVITYAALGPAGAMVPTSDVGGGTTRTYSYSGGLFTDETVT